MVEPNLLTWAEFLAKCVVRNSLLYTHTCILILSLYLGFLYTHSHMVIKPLHYAASFSGLTDPCFCHRHLLIWGQKSGIVTICVCYALESCLYRQVVGLLNSELFHFYSGDPPTWSATWFCETYYVEVASM